jgi:hypothetical protein
MLKINKYLITAMTMCIPAMVISGCNKHETQAENVGKKIDEAVTWMKKDAKNTANVVGKNINSIAKQTR